MSEEEEIDLKEKDRLYALYPNIVAWGRKLGSYDYYIINQCAMAEREAAPKDAIFRDRKGKWHTMDLETIIS